MHSVNENLEKPERLKAILLMVITATLWSLGGILIKSVNWNPLAIAGMRSSIACCILLIAIRKPKLTWSLPQIGATISYASLLILFVSANKMTTSANAILLQFTAPIYVAMLGSWILKEKTRVSDWITIFIVLIGMSLFFFDNINSKGFIGNVLAILSGISFAFFTVFMRMQKDGSPIESILLGNLLTAVIGIPFMLQPSGSKINWVCLLLLGVFQVGIPYILYSKAIKNISAIEAVLIPVIEPILNPVWVLLLVGELPGRLALIGGFIVIVTITIRCIFLSMNPNEVFK